MRSRHRASASLAVLLVGLLAASGGLVAGSARAAGPVPQALVAVESGAEDIIDLALGGERGQVIGRAAALSAASRGAAASALAAAGTPPAQLARLRSRAALLVRRARNGSTIQILLAANAVSELMPALYARFQSPVPPSVLELDYLDREAQFRALARQRARIPALVATLARTWAGVRPRVLAKGGASEAAAYDRHVAAMRRLAPAGGRGVQREAVNGLNLVDELEGILGG